MGLPLNVENTHIHNPINYGGVEVFNMEVPIGVDIHRPYTLKFEIIDGSKHLGSDSMETNFGNLQIGYLKLRNILSRIFEDHSEEDIDQIIYTVSMERTISDCIHNIKGNPHSLEEEFRSWTTEFHFDECQKYYRNEMSDDHREYFEHLMWMCNQSFYYLKLMESIEPSDLSDILKRSDSLVFTLEVNLTDERIEDLVEDTDVVDYLKKKGVVDPNEIRTEVKKMGCLTFSTTSFDGTVLLKPLFKKRLETQH